MKSIIEQASSIMKAIEKAWDQAEKPQEFSIKIFEKEEKNFFGITTKPAKIGIFFGDKNEKTTAYDKQSHKVAEIKECRPETRVEKPKASSQPSNHSKKEHPMPSRVEPRTQKVQPQENAYSKPSHQRPADTTAEKRKNPKKEEKKPTILATWNDAMVSSTQSWLSKTLELMGMHSIHFTSEISGKNLKLMFNVPLIADPLHEKQLFRSFAHLIMSSLRNQYKQEVKDLKVILIRPE